MYQALYRKWRPRTFDDVVGQEHITETLKNQIKNERLSHAYLFVGTRGTGKTTCAKILARAVNCEHPVDGNPCNKCKSCLGIIDGSVMDVEEMDAASNNGVENVRALRDEAVFSPASVKKRVYIIDEVHMLSSSAFNALLKILEEPPEHLMFILATTELHKVPATILSRCQRYSFRRINNYTIAHRLQKISEGEKITLTPEAAEILSRLSEGSMRDAISLLDQCAGNETITAEIVLSAMGLAGSSRAAELLNLIADNDTQGAINCFTKLWMDGKDPATLLSELASLYRDVLICKIAPKGSGELLSSGYEMKALADLGDKLDNKTLLYNLDTVQAAQAELKYCLSPRVAVEMCLVRLSSPEISEGILSLSSRVSKLESILENGTVAPLQSNIPRPDFTPPKSDKKPLATSQPTNDIPPDKKRTAIAELSSEKQEPAPEYQVSSTPVSESGAKYDGECWSGILVKLKKVLPMAKYNIISDPAHSQVVFEDGKLKLYVTKGFPMDMLNTPVVLDSIRSVLSETGSALTIKVEEGRPPVQSAEPDKNKIDNLVKFGNVKFE